MGARSARGGRVYPGPRPPGPDLLSSERDHIQGPVHEAPVQHLGAALAHDRVACPVVGSDVLAGGDGVSPQPGGDRDAGGAVVGDPCPDRGDAQVVGALPTRPEVGGACKLRLPGHGVMTGRIQRVRLCAESEDPTSELAVEGEEFPGSQGRGRGSRRRGQDYRGQGAGAAPGKSRKSSSGRGWWGKRTGSRS